MDKERILFIDLGSHYGGVETYLRGLGAILSPYTQGYAVLSLPELALQLRAQGMTVVCLPILGSKWLKALRLLLACFVVPYMLLRFRIRTVQVNGFFESLLLGPLRLFGCKTIFTMHIPFETELYSWFRNPERWVPRFLSKHSLRFATQVVCVSETLGEIARTVLPQEKVRVIANWVESPSTIRRTFSTSKRPQLLFVGRLTAQVPADHPAAVHERRQVVGRLIPAQREPGRGGLGMQHASAHRRSRGDGRRVHATKGSCRVCSRHRRCAPLVSRA